MPQSYITFNNGQQCPIVGFGTRKGDAEETKQAIRAALDAGYRHLDTAAAYQNEAAIGEVLQEYFSAGKLHRQDVFITTKLFVTHMSQERVPEALEGSLKALQLDYVDLYLVHFPIAFIDTGRMDEMGIIPAYEDGTHAVTTTDHLSVWRGMENAVRAGKAKSIGLSNFNARQVKRICENCSILPVTNQVECHAYLSQLKLQQFMAKWGIFLTAFCSLGSSDKPDAFKQSGEPILLEDPLVRELASKYGKTPAQILLMNLIQRNIIVIPRSSNPSRMRENIEALNFCLSEEDQERMLALDRGFRFFNPPIGGKDHPEYPYTDEF